MITIRRAGDLDIKAVERIAWAAESVTLHPEAIGHVDRSRETMLAALEGRRVYGVNTGMGYLAGADLSPRQQAGHQRNLLLGRAVGGAPFLSREEARAVLAARLVNFLSGHAGVTAALCRYIAARLNDDFVPAIPRRSIGGAGEIIPLAHTFQTFLGIGQVIESDGTVAAASDALARRCAAPYEPSDKEGVALLAGAPCAAALAIGRWRAATALAARLERSAACAIDALRAPLDVYGAASGRLAGDDTIDDVLRDLRDHLRGSALQRRGHQAPVSFRVAAQVLAHLRRTLARLAEDADRTLRGVSDSPAFVDGGFVSTGGFHAIEAAAGMDGLAAALVRCAEIAGQRVHRLLDSRFSGLPDQLAPGPHAGLVVVHKRVTGALNELRRRATPASIGLADTSLGQEDAMTFVFEAAENLREVESLATDVVACELLCCRQAWALRGGVAADGLQPLAGRLQALVEPIFEDRPLGDDLVRVRTLLAEDPLFR